MTKAIIPLKTNSTRVPNKNLRPFYKDKSLFDIRADGLLRVLPAGGVYVSSENPVVEKHAAKYGFNFLLRDEYLTYNDTPFSDVITSITAQIPGRDDLLWTYVTDPLFDQFAACLETWDRVKCRHDSLLLVVPFREHLIDATGRPINHGLGRWHKHSGQLPQWFTYPGSLQIITRRATERCSYFIGETPYLYQYTGPSLDIDTPDQFNQARAIYSNCKRIGTF